MGETISYGIKKSRTDILPSGIFYAAVLRQFLFFQSDHVPGSLVQHTGHDSILHSTSGNSPGRYHFFSGAVAQLHILVLLF